MNQLWGERVRGERQKESEARESDRETEKRETGKEGIEKKNPGILLTELNTCVCLYAKIPSLDKENTSK